MKFKYRGLHDNIETRIYEFNKNYDFKSGNGFYEDINIELDSYEDSKEPVNIVSIGIGGSFEGPKLMFEASNPLIDFDKSMNFEFITGPNSKEFIGKVKHLNPKKLFL